MPRKQIKDEKTYEAVRGEGASKEKAARTANASAGSSRRSVGRKGVEARTYENRSKHDLYEEAKKAGIEGRSQMSKSELIEALRNR